MALMRHCPLPATRMRSELAKCSTSATLASADRVGDRFGTEWCVTALETTVS